MFHQKYLHSGWIILALTLSACAPMEFDFETPSYLAEDSTPTALGPVSMHLTATSRPDRTATPTTSVTPPPTATETASPTATATATPPPLPSQTLLPLPTVGPSSTPTQEMPQTPTPGWYFYVSEAYGLQLQYPNHWQVQGTPGIWLAGEDGFFMLFATNSQDNLLENACQDMLNTQVAGAGPRLEYTTVAGQPACLIWPAATLPQGTAVLIARFPEARDNILPGTSYTFLILQADPAHLPGLRDSLRFLPPASLTPTASPTSGT